MGRKEQFQGVYPRQASILISFQWDGQRYRESLPLKPTVPNQRAAARIRDEVMDLIRLGRFTWQEFAERFPDSPRLKRAGTTGQVLFVDVAETWLKLKEAELSSTTLTEYENALARYFLPVYGDRPIRSITYEELALYMAGLDIRAAKTFNNIMTPLRGVFEYAMRTGKVTTDVTRDIKSRRGQKPLPDPLTTEEVELVLDHVLSKYGAQWHNYFEFAFFSGCRPSEQIALLWTSMDMRQGQARIERARVRATDKDTKTHTARDINLLTRAMKAVTRQKQHSFLANEHVFLNPVTGERFTDTSAPMDLVWRPTLRALGIRHRDARQTRHTYATMCLMAGMNPAYVSRQMGHTNPRMFFEVYSKWIDGDASHRENAKMDAYFAAPEALAQATAL